MRGHQVLPPRRHFFSDIANLLDVWIMVENDMPPFLRRLFRNKMGMKLLVRHFISILEEDFKRISGPWYSPRAKLVISSGCESRTNYGGV
jgi:hypothetical protein